MTPAEASALILAAREQGHMRQFIYRETEADGTTYVNILGAMGPTVLSAEDTPATVMPIWMGYLCASLFDDQEFEASLEWTDQIGLQMADADWVNIEWETVQTEMLLRAIEAAASPSIATQPADRLSIPNLYSLTRQAVETQAGLEAALAACQTAIPTMDQNGTDIVTCFMWACKSPIAPAAGVATAIANVGVNACLAAAARVMAQGNSTAAIRAGQALTLCDVIADQL